MIDKSALFLVQSPLHVHNAKEAIDKFCITHPTFFITTSKRSAKWARMIKNILPTHSHCIFAERSDNDIETCTENYMRHIPWLQNQSFDYVFFCDTRLYIFVDIVKLLRHPNTYLIDDGAATIISIHVLRQFDQYFEEYQSSVASRRLQIENVKRKYKIWNLPQIKYNLFTAFDFDRCEKFDVVQNPMHHLAHVHNNVDPNKILFIGQPLINSGYVNLKTYSQYCDKISQYYGDKDVLYLPHPREDINDARELSKRVGFDLVETELAAEAYLKKEVEAPSMVCGFYSTALWNIAKFHKGLKVDAHRLLLNQSNISQKKHIVRSNHLSELDCIDLYYQYYQKRMNVVDPLLE